MNEPSRGGNSCGPEVVGTKNAVSTGAAGGRVFDPAKAKGARPAAGGLSEGSSAGADP